MNAAEQTTDTLRIAAWLALAVGVAGAVLSAAGYASDATQFARAYLLAFAFWLQIPLGCLGIALLHQLTGGRWGEFLRVFLATGLVTLPLFVLLFIPVWLQMEALFPWHLDAVGAAVHISDEKRLFLNETGFTWRSGGYLAVWCIGSVICSRWSVRPLAAEEADRAGRRQRTAALGVLLFVVTVSFAGVDWLMSLEPAWYSSIYGGLVAVGAVLAAWCFAAVMGGLFGPAAGETQPLHDVGNLLMAFLMMWAYFALSQFLIIWSGDLPEEIVWYEHRLHGGWEYLVPVIAFGHFAIPFAMLLSRDVKRKPGALAAVAGGLLLMRFVEMYWSVMPAFSPGAFAFHWLIPVTWLGVGGLWFGLFALLLNRRLRRRGYEGSSRE